MDLARSATATCTCRRFMLHLLRRGCAAGDTAVGALAAVLGQVTDQAVHGLEVRRLVERAAVAARAHEAGVLEPGQMERERGRGEPELLPDGPHRQARGPGLH